MGLGILNKVHPFLPLILYLCVFVFAIVSIVKDTKIGIGFLLIILPFPLLLKKAHQFPLGNQLTDILFISIFLGMLFQGKKIVKTDSTKPIIYLFFATIIGLFIGFLDSSAPYNVDHINRVALLKNYLMMPILYFFIVSNIKDKSDVKKIIYIIFLIVLIKDWRFWNSFKYVHIGDSFSDNSRMGAFGELGSNHFAAFIVEYLAVLIGVTLFTEKKKFIPIYGLGIIINIFVLFYTYSRAAYLALGFLFLFFGIFRKKLIIISTIVVLLFGSLIVSYLPPSVVNRVEMTTTEEGELEGSSAHRVTIWKIGWDIFLQNPVLGIGYHMTPSYILVDGLQNMHNYFLQVLVELGLVGFFLFLFLFFSASKSGWILYKITSDSFEKGIGLGFCGCVFASMICNFFGDRWTFIEMQGYWWAIWGLIDVCIIQNKQGNLKDAILVKD
jgi:O-antigen ligase